LGDFAYDMFPEMDECRFHRNYYKLLDAFAKKKVRKMIVTMPPQHGKSHGSSVLLPAYILGLDPDRKIAIASYSAYLASRFNRRVQRLIESKQYAEIFPETTIKKVGSSKPSESGSYIRTSEHVEIIDHDGELLSVGREGSLTGNRVDTFIIDDLYTDALEAWSPVVRENCWDWYVSVVRTRMHNDSNELIVNTRWHEEDLIGMIGKYETVKQISNWDELENWPADVWLHLNLEALKHSPPTQIDPREMDEPLWEGRQDRNLLLKKRALNPINFECMYQGRPSPPQGMLYGRGFELYETLPENMIPVRQNAYVDTADTGEDFMCAVFYVVDKQGDIWVIDVYHSDEPMEITEEKIAEKLIDNRIQTAHVESNNGGRGFARAIKKLAPQVRVEPFYQSGNKEARILSNASTVLNKIHFPADWAIRWPAFTYHVTTYRRLFRANRWHDAADVLTGIVEKELPDLVTRKKISAVRFSVRR
jgi:predicted phage terminase large subunit-like protein